MAAPMAPPLSPKERRRSNRRSAHSSASASTSKSSGSPSPDASLPPPPKETDAHSARSAASSSSNNATTRKQRNKDDTEDLPPASSMGHRRTVSVSSATNHSSNASNSKRSKRKGGKEPMGPVDEVEDPTPVVHAEPEPAGGDKTEDDAGITRCVCEGLVDDEGDGADFMVQCERCLVWQHGPCVGFADEGEIPEGEYFCEQCKPEDHVDLLKKLQKRQRQNSEKSHAQQSRNSRSRSPSHFLKATKRRNTMNSRDAAYDEQIQKLLDATAAEAVHVTLEVQPKEYMSPVEKHVETTDETNEAAQGSKKKRKRIDDEPANTKRKRSASMISERVPLSVDKVVETHVQSVLSSGASQAPLPPTSSSSRSRVRRSGGRKHVARDASVIGEGEEGVPTRKHPNQYTYRVKSATISQPRRAPQSSMNQNPAIAHEHGTRRSAGGSGNTAASNSGSRTTYNAYYSNIQLPMFTSWNLPDYLAHLQSILPSEVPPPLHIRGAADFLRELSDTGSSIANGVETSSVIGADESGNEKMATVLANATDSLVERGVKVKWPAKRMSVADMNKRVRALVEWVGREQALALDRERRRVAILSSLKNQLPTFNSVSVDGEPSASVASSMTKSNSAADGISCDSSNEASAARSPPDTRITADRPSTTKMMEELMEELINFQERFGPGAKGQVRERANRSTVG